MGKKHKKKKKDKAASVEDAVQNTNKARSRPARSKMKNKEYEAELFKPRVELVKLQEWVKKTGARIVIVFEGRDGAHGRDQ